MIWKRCCNTGDALLGVGLLFVLLMHPADSMAENSGGSNLKRSVRIASMNVSLYGKSYGEVASRLAGGADAQAIRLAQVIRTVRPDVLLLCEVDHETEGTTLDRFADLYLAAESLHVGGDDSQRIDYPHRWSIPTNTGLLSDIDLDDDGRKSLPLDAWGFGNYPGQYAMAVLSRFPMDRDGIRTFQEYKWSQLPDALQPINPDSGEPFYRDEVWDALRLSSKNHVDIPIKVSLDGDPTARVKTIHLLACHPTPPVFDGREDRNGKRNHDEIQFWNDYISNPKARYLTDDSGGVGGLPSGESFVIAGDLNSDPDHGDSLRAAIIGLIDHPQVNDVLPSSIGHGIATALFGRREVRVDYVLPSADLNVTGGAVVWPGEGDTLEKALEATDHRMVWIDVEVP